MDKTAILEAAPPLTTGAAATPAGPAELSPAVKQLLEELEQTLKDGESGAMDASNMQKVLAEMVREDIPRLVLLSHSFSTCAQLYQWSVPVLDCDLCPMSVKALATRAESTLVIVNVVGPSPDTSICFRRGVAAMFRVFLGGVGLTLGYGHRWAVNTFVHEPPA